MYWAETGGRHADATKSAIPKKLDWPVGSISLRLGALDNG
jgi:hypothetical protein